MTWEDATAAVGEMAALGPDWDGLGATPPPLMVIHEAWKYARWKGGDSDALPPTRVAAGPNGSIVFEWDDGKTLRTVTFEEYTR